MEHSTDTHSMRYGPELRILIVGGGIAGLTLARLLRQRGFSPVVAEKADEYGEEGYVIVLSPAGGRVLKGLGLYGKLEELGVKLGRYEVANSDGELINSYSTQSLAEKYGPNVAIYRPELIDLLREAVDPGSVRMDTIVEDIHQENLAARVTFGDGETEDFDLIVGCDGIDSGVRRMVFGEADKTYSGMTGWGFWVEPMERVSSSSLEYWGEGKAIGLFPTRDRLCAVAAIKAPERTPDPPEGRIGRIRENFGDFGGVVPRILERLDRPEEMWHDDFVYLLAKRWHKGRIVLAGDSAHAFSPTSGLGAAMAMESAAVLAEELCRADSWRISRALEFYEARRKQRVRKLQRGARVFDRIPVAESLAVTKMRDLALSHLPEERFAESWASGLQEPI